MPAVVLVGTAVGVFIEKTTSATESQWAPPSRGVGGGGHDDHVHVYDDVDDGVPQRQLPLWQWKCRPPEDHDISSNFGECSDVDCDAHDYSQQSYYAQGGAIREHRHNLSYLGPAGYQQTSDGSGTAEVLRGTAVAGGTAGLCGAAVPHPGRAATPGQTPAQSDVGPEAGFGHHETAALPETVTLPETAALPAALPETAALSETATLP